ncbi:hypothetical protein VTJ04DRAFT_4678 [Mycothermus thermophilus]|uniref:uncharacterized protein n=1 Tax=Humicola insolens TaxID=85995 RepID=UPI0037436F65
MIVVADLHREAHCPNLSCLAEFLHDRCAAFLGLGRGNQAKKIRILWLRTCSFREREGALPAGPWGYTPGIRVENQSFGLERRLVLAGEFRADMPCLSTPSIPFPAPRILLHHALLDGSEVREITRPEGYRISLFGSFLSSSATFCSTFLVFMCVFFFPFCLDSVVGHIEGGGEQEGGGILKLAGHGCTPLPTVGRWEQMPVMAGREGIFTSVLVYAILDHMEFRLCSMSCWVDISRGTVSMRYQLALGT